MYDSERRQFVRIPLTVPINFNLISSESGNKVGPAFKGETSNVGAGGVLVTGEMPPVEDVTALIVQRLILAGEMEMPDDPKPILFLGRVAWIEDIDTENRRCSLGVIFKELTQLDRDRLYQFVIRSTMM